MHDRRGILYRASFVLAGVSLALWATLHPWGTIAGPEVGGSTRWVISHTFHFTSGIFASIGLLGLHALLSGGTRFEGIAYLTAFVGSVMWTGTGVITAFVWPILATHAPALTELSGPIFTPPHPVIGVTAVLFSLGFILLWIAMARQKTMGRGVAIVGCLGALMLVPPPPPLSPVPWIFLPVGGILFGLGVMSLAPLISKNVGVATAAPIR